MGLFTSDTKWYLPSRGVAVTCYIYDGQKSVAIKLHCTT